jgi:phage virion morphogenesis protein
MRVEAEGIDEAKSELDAVKGRIANLKPVMEVAVQDTVTLIDDAFENQTSPAGAPWAPLQASTIERRRTGDGNGSPKILIDTGRLRQSVTGRANRRGFRFGTNAVYAGAQQFGAQRAGRSNNVNLPARPFLPIENAGGNFQLSTTGAAGVHWRQVRRMIADYIRTGRIT